MDATRMQVAEYLRDLSKQLSLQARAAHFDTAAYLLDEVTLEMAREVEAAKQKPKRLTA
jgi:hypothetical protein